MSTVANFFAPSDLSGISGTKCEHIYAINRWRNSTGHFDTLFVNAAPDDMLCETAKCQILTDNFTFHILNFCLLSVKF